MKWNLIFWSLITIELRLLTLLRTLSCSLGLCQLIDLALLTHISFMLRPPDLLSCGIQIWNHFLPQTQISFVLISKRFIERVEQGEIWSIFQSQLACLQNWVVEIWIFKVLFVLTEDYINLTHRFFSFNACQWCSNFLLLLYVDDLVKV